MKFNLEKSPKEKRFTLWRDIYNNCKYKRIKVCITSKLTRCKLTNGFCNDKNCQKYNYLLRRKDDKNSNNKDKRKRKQKTKKRTQRST